MKRLNKKKMAEISPENFSKKLLKRVSASFSLYDSAHLKGISLNDVRKFTEAELFYINNAWYKDEIQTKKLPKEEAVAMSAEEREGLRKILRIDPDMMLIGSKINL